MAVLFAFVSAMCGGGSDFIGGLASKRLHVAWVVGLSQGIALLIFGAIAVVVRPDLLQSDLWWAVGAGQCMIVGLVGFYAALATGTMGVVAPVSALGVVVPLGWALLVYGESPRAGQMIGIAIAIVGVVLASGPELSGSSSARPLVLSVISALGFGSLALLLERSTPAGVLATALVLKVSLCVSLGFWLLLRGGRPRAEARSAWRSLVTIGIFDSLATVCLTYAFTLGYLSVVSVVASLYPIVTVVLGRLVLKEETMRVQRLGVVGTFLGIAMIAAG